MKRILKTSMYLFVAGLIFTSCKKNSVTPANTDEVSADVLTQIKAMGFSNTNVIKDDGGYIAEGDIFISNEQLGQKLSGPNLVIANVEQYHTTNVVTGLPREITVALNSKLSGKAGYIAALDEMVRRYNAENLLIHFTRVNSGATITFSDAHGSYLASSGFPTSGGAPYSSVKVNSLAIGTGTSTTFVNYLATIFAHEVGHTIGFRHTDYADRSFSCGGSTANEGASTVGAIYIPGTAVGPNDDPTSFMLACISSGQNRPFNANDKTALNFLF